MKRIYIFINWEEKDIVLTYSRPGADYEGGAYLPNHDPKQGKKAKNLLANGYRYIGSFCGFNISSITNL